MQNVNNGHNGANRRKHKQTQGRPKNGPVTTIVPDKLLWSVVTAMALPERILVVDRTTILICNSLHHKNYMRKVLRHD